MIAGAVLSALLVIVGANTFVNLLYPTGGSPEAPPEQAADASSGGQAPAGGETAPAEPAMSFASLLSKASADAGQSQAKKCAACHGFDEGGANKIGPNLHGIVGRAVASHEGFAYSAALQSYGGNWDYEKLDCFLENPKNCVPGNKMSFAGVKKDSDRADIIAYLRSVSPNAPPLPAAEADTSGQPAEANAAPASASGESTATEKPAAEAASTDAAKPAEKPAAEAASTDAAKPAEKPTAEAASTDTAKPAEKPVAEAAPKDAAQPAEKPVAEAAPKDAAQPAGKSADQAGTQAAEGANAPAGANAAATPPAGQTQN
jgi:cytochrome c